VAIHRIQQHKPDNSIHGKSEKVDTLIMFDKSKLILTELARGALEEALPFQWLGEANEGVPDRTGPDLGSMDALIQEVLVESVRHGNEIFLSHWRSQMSNGQVSVGALDVQSQVSSGACGRNVGEHTRSPHKTSHEVGVGIQGKVRHGI
jgi:hypothetical protein